jgi:hypothetical protein
LNIDVTIELIQNRSFQPTASTFWVKLQRAE